jgi:hypothetical protein
MPRKSATPAKALTASAATVTPAQRKKIRRRQPWQSEAWGYFDRVGEYRFAMGWTALATSRATLQVQTVDKDGEWVDADPTHPAVTFLDELLTGCGGEAQFLYRVAIHLSVPGESYILGQDTTDPDGQVDGYSWRVLDVSEIKERQGVQSVTNPATGDEQPITDDDRLIRVWRPHPQDVSRADSASRAALPVLEEIEDLGKHIKATIDSRLASNGLLLFPDEVSITTTTTPATTAGKTTEDGSDPFMTALTEAMIAPITDRDSAGAVVPPIIRAPGEQIDKVKHLVLATPFDANVQTMRQDAIRRLALGLDMPPEQLLGVASNSNMWSSWQVTEDAVKTTIAPILALICDALTGKFLTPVMEAAGNPGRYRVTFDVDDLIQRPNNASQALDLYDRQEVTGAALRDASGVEVFDAPDDDEWRRQFARALLRQGVLSDELAVLAGLGAGVLPAASAAPQGDAPAPQDAPSVLNPGGTPDTQDEQPEPAQATITAASTLIREGLAHYGRALKRADGGHALKDIPEAERYLHAKTAIPLPPGVTGPSAIVASALGVCPDTFTQTVRDGIEHLVATRTPFGGAS